MELADATGIFNVLRMQNMVRKHSLHQGRYSRLMKKRELIGY